MVYLITGKAGAGKSTYAYRLSRDLKKENISSVIIDGDEYRKEKKNNDYSDKGRLKNLLGAAKLAVELESQVDVVMLSFIAPRKEWRQAMRQLWKESLVVYIPGGTLWKNTTYEMPDKEEMQIQKI